MDELWNMWVWVAFAVPVLFALDCVLDVFFIDRYLYRNPLHASIITGLFSGAVLVLLLPGYKSFQLPEFQILFLAVANGVIYLLYIYFYFKALFKLNDAANLETFLGFSVFLVPVLGFLVLDEQFFQKHYLGIGIASCGVAILAFANCQRGQFSKSLVTMSSAIVLLSVTFVIQDKVYAHVGFYTGLVLFLIGKLMAAVLLWAGSDCKGVISDARKFSRLFIFSQLVGVIAVVFVQRAINISPSVTIVAAIEASTPFFIMVFSLLLIPIISVGHANGVQNVLKLQLEKVPAKIIATGFLLIGIILIADSPTTSVAAEQTWPIAFSMGCCLPTL